MTPTCGGFADAPVHGLSGPGQAAVDECADVLVDVFHDHWFALIEVNLHATLRIDTTARAIGISEVNLHLADARTQPRKGETRASLNLLTMFGFQYQVMGLNVDSHGGLAAESS